jgi:hypothetical protein
MTKSRLSKINKRWNKLLRIESKEDPLTDITTRVDIRRRTMKSLRPTDYRGFNINISTVWNKFKKYRSYKNGRSKSS